MLGDFLTYLQSMRQDTAAEAGRLGARPQTDQHASPYPLGSFWSLCFFDINRSLRGLAVFKLFS